VLVRVFAQIASRFGIVVTQKLAAQAVPLIGGVGGAAVNYEAICGSPPAKLKEAVKERISQT
jgi:hypothetical protein